MIYFLTFLQQSYIFVPNKQLTGFVSQYSYEQVHITINNEIVWILQYDEVDKATEYVIFDNAQEIYITVDGKQSKNILSNQQNLQEFQTFNNFSFQIIPFNGFYNQSQVIKPTVRNSSQELIVGHRGSGKNSSFLDDNHPAENTLDSYNLALKNGADGIELDVILSQDQKFIVHHNLHLPENDSVHFIHKVNSTSKYVKGFPTFQDVLQNISEDHLIVVEIKYPQLNKYYTFQNQMLDYYSRRQIVDQLKSELQNQTTQQWRKNIILQAFDEHLCLLLKELPYTVFRLSMGIFQGDIGDFGSQDIDYTRPESFNVVRTAATTQMDGIVTRKELLLTPSAAKITSDINKALNNAGKILGIWGFTYHNITHISGENVYIYIVDCLGDYKCKN